MNYIFKGKTYASFDAFYKDNKSLATSSSTTVAKLIKRGFTLEEALTMPTLPRGSRTVLGTHTVNGEVFTNITELAKVYGMPANAVYKRYSRGCRDDDLIPLKKRFKDGQMPISAPAKKEVRRFLVGGVEYKNVADACQKLRVKIVTYQTRRRRGFTPEQALGLSPIVDRRQERGQRFDVDGTPKTLTALCEEHKASEATARDRLARGATIRQALGLDAIPRGSLKSQREAKRATTREKHSFAVDGKIYTSYKSLADAYDLPAYTVRNRIADYGYTPEEAVKSIGKSQPVLFGGVEYRSRSALAEAYGIRPDVLTARLNNGDTLEQALRVVPKPSPIAFEFGGKTFPSLNALAREHGLTAGVIRKRMMNGASLDEAIAMGKRIANAGRYTLTQLEANDELANRLARLYFARLVVDGKNVFKVGVSTREGNGSLKFQASEFEMLKSVNGTLIDCFRLKQAVVSVLGDRRKSDLTGEQLNGYTNTFDLDEHDVKSMLKILDGTAKGEVNV